MSCQRTEDHNRVEAVLFALGKDVSVEEISRLVKLDEKKVKELISELKECYASDDSSLFIVERDGIFKFTIKDSYLPLVSNLIREMDLDRGTLETLAVIAWKHPALQADIIKIRHNKAYDHMKVLEEKGFVVKERFGRTFKIKLTDKFFQYFDIPSHDAKEAFKKVIPQEIQKSVERSEEEINEREAMLKQALKRKEELEMQYREEKSDEQKAVEAAAEVDEDDTE